MTHQTQEGAGSHGDDEANMSDAELAAIGPLDGAAKSTYKHLVYHTLYELIQELKIRPGARLVEAEVVARFGVSKTPIREALLLLEKDGLVSAVPHFGATVTALSFEEYEQGLFVLDALEQPALNRIVERNTASELERCAHLVEEIKGAYAERNGALYTQLVLRYHSELFGTAHMPLLTKTVNGIQQSLRRYPAVFTRPFEEEWKIECETVVKRFELIRNGEPAKAAATVQEGHALLLEAARRRVENEDPAVLPFLRPSG